MEGMQDQATVIRVTQYAVPILKWSYDFHFFLNIYTLAVCILVATMKGVS